MRYIIKVSLAMLITGCGLAAHAESSSAPSVPMSTTVAPTTTTTTTTVASTTTTTTTTLPPLTFVPRCPNLIPYAREAGWPDPELEMLDRIAFRESRCSITADGQFRCAHNAGDPGSGAGKGSWGPYQVNQSWVVKNRWNPHPAGFLGALGIAQDVLDLCRWDVAARAAKALYDYSLNRHGYDLRWRPWYPLPKD